MQPGSSLRKLFDEISDGRLQWNPMPEVYDRIRIGDRSYDFVRGTRRLPRACAGTSRAKNKPSAGI